MSTVPEKVASMTFADITDTSFIVVWSRPYFTNGRLTGMYVSVWDKAYCHLLSYCSLKHSGTVGIYHIMSCI